MTKERLAVYKITESEETVIINRFYDTLTPDDDMLLINSILNNLLKFTEKNECCDEHKEVVKFLKETHEKLQPLIFNNNKKNNEENSKENSFEVKLNDMLDEFIRMKMKPH